MPDCAAASLLQTQAFRGAICSHQHNFHIISQEIRDISALYIWKWLQIVTNVKGAIKYCTPACGPQHCGAVRCTVSLVEPQSKTAPKYVQKKAALQKWLLLIHSFL